MGLQQDQSDSDLGSSSSTVTPPAQALKAQTSITALNPARNDWSSSQAAWLSCPGVRRGGSGMSCNRARFVHICCWAWTGKVEWPSWALKVATNPCVSTNASTETARSAARREVALFTAEAMPVWVGGTDDMTALVSGATASVSPQPRRMTGGRTDRAYPWRGVSQANAAKPVPASAAPAHIKSRSPTLGTNDPTRAENT